MIAAFGEIKNFHSNSLNPFTSQGLRKILTFSETILEIEEHCLQKNRERPIYNIEIKSKKSAWDNFKTPEPAGEIFVQLLLKELSMLDIQDRFYIQSFDRRCLTS